MADITPRTLPNSPVRRGRHIKQSTNMTHGVGVVELTAHSRFLLNLGAGFLLYFVATGWGQTVVFISS